MGLQKPLILPLQLVVEDDSLNAVAAGLMAAGRVRVRAIKLRVVTQLARLGDVAIERLPRFVVARPLMPFEQSSAFLRQRHRDRPLPIAELRTHELDQLPFSKVREVAVPTVRGPGGEVA